MYKYLRRLLSVADTIGTITSVYVGEYGERFTAINLQGNTKKGKIFYLDLKIVNEEVDDGT